MLKAGKLEALKWDEKFETLDYWCVIKLGPESNDI